MLISFFVLKLSFLYFEPLLQPCVLVSHQASFLSLVQFARKMYSIGLFIVASASLASAALDCCSNTQANTLGLHANQGFTYVTPSSPEECSAYCQQFEQTVDWWYDTVECDCFDVAASETVSIEGFYYGTCVEVTGPTTTTTPIVQSSTSTSTIPAISTTSTEAVTTPTTSTTEAIPSPLQLRMPPHLLLLSVLLLHS